VRYIVTDDISQDAATGDGRRATGDGRRATGDGRRATGDGRRRLAAGGWRLAAGGWRLAAGGWRLAAGRKFLRSALVKPFLENGMKQKKAGLTGLVFPLGGIQPFSPDPLLPFQRKS